MPSTVAWLLGASGAINENHNLFVLPSKHMFLSAKGLVRRQSSPIQWKARQGDSRLTNMIVMDEATSVFYAELRTSDEKDDVLGFLARAWSVKPDHPMHGVPRTLNISPSLKVGITRPIKALCQANGIAVGSNPKGFASGVAQATAQLERVIAEASVAASKLRETGWLKACSAAISRDACQVAANVTQESWSEIPAPDHEFFAWIDQKIGPSWREEPWNFVLDGLVGRKQ